MSSDTLPVSDFQKRALVIPEGFDMFLGGGRGGSKSTTLGLLALRHAEQYGPDARALYVRQSYKGLADFESITRELFGAAYGRAASYNAAEHVWRLPRGAYFELGQLEGPGDYLKYQGRSFTLLLVDEAGHYASPDLLDRLRSNLRAREGMATRVVMAANPGDPGHHWLASRYVFNATGPWHPFFEPKSGRTWVYAPSTFRDNPFIDQAAYRRELLASCPLDPELCRAWLDGDWAIARGAFFAGVLSEERSALDPSVWVPEWFAAARSRIEDDRWRLSLAHDFGVSAPSVTFVCARSPGAPGPDGRWYPRDSILLVDELATNEPDSLTRGLQWTVPKLGEAIRALAKGWGMSPSGVADDAIFARTGSGAGAIAEEFRRAGVNFRAARKGSRVAGWEQMRRMLEDAGKPDRPGLFVSRRCEYFWATVPYLARDPRKADDVDSRGPDHAADACRYAVGRGGDQGAESFDPRAVMAPEGDGLLGALRRWAREQDEKEEDQRGGRRW